MDRSSSEYDDESSSADSRKRRSSNRLTKKTSIKNYVSDVLTKHERGDEQPIDTAQTQIKITTSPSPFPGYENLSAFRRYQSTTEGTSRTNTQRQRQESFSTDDEVRDQTPTEPVRSTQFL